jgi:hypothetical protein
MPMPPMIWLRAVFWFRMRPLGREVGTSAYRDPKGRPKTVRYWEMTPTRGTLGAANEIDDARWVPLQEAAMLLTYQHDRRLLDGWQPAG